MDRVSRLVKTALLIRDGALGEENWHRHLLEMVPMTSGAVRALIPAEPQFAVGKSLCSPGLQHLSIIKDPGLPQWLPNPARFKHRLPGPTTAY